MSNAYYFWLSNVKRLLVHPDALLCTVVTPEAAMPGFFTAGFSAKRIAKELNHRFNDGYLERKLALEASKK